MDLKGIFFRQHVFFFGGGGGEGGGGGGGGFVWGMVGGGGGGGGVLDRCSVPCTSTPNLQTTNPTSCSDFSRSLSCPESWTRIAHEGSKVDAILVPDGRGRLKYRS